MTFNLTISRSRAAGAAFAGLILTAIPGVALGDILNVPGDYPTIQEAVNAAVAGDEVLIAPGMYVNTAVITINKAITVRGSGGAAVTTIATGSAFEGIIDLSGGPDTVLDGLTISGGSSFFGGIGAVDVSGSPTIMNCTFRDNTMSAIVQSVTGGMVVSNCQFIDNSDADEVGAALDIRTGTATIIGCTFTGNSARYGGAIVIGGGAIMDCTFDQNMSTGANSLLGGGAIITVWPGVASEVLIDNCTFDGNDSAGTGGAVTTDGANANVTISDCVFTANSAAMRGGAAFLRGAGVSVESSTFDGNDAATGGGVFLLESATATGCTFTNNTCLTAGAGLAAENANATGCNFTGNQSAGDGGAMHALGTTSVLTICDASGNTAAGVGGGVHVAAGATATIDALRLCNNVPDQINGLVFIAGGLLSCDPTVGACCLPQGGCVLTTQANCIATGGTYQGDGTDCGSAGCPEPCSGDVNGDGLVNVTDLLALLAAWGACP